MANPAFSDKILERAMSGFSEKGQTMTVNGTINKAFILTLLLLASGIYTYNMVSAGNVASAMSYLMGGIIGGLIVGIIMMFKMEWARFLAPVYAVLEGLAIGAISGVYGMAFQGIVGQAIFLTVAVLLIMLATYRFGIIKVTDKFRSIMIVAIGAVGLFYLVLMIVGIFSNTPSFYAGNSVLSIVISLAIVGIAAFSLLLDFDFIERGSQAGAPKYMEWYGAYGLLVTLVWLYLEILRLLSKLQSRD